MAKIEVYRGATSGIFHIFIQDSSSTTGAGKTALAYNTASLAAKYLHSGGTLSAALTLQDITTLGTYEAPTSNAHMRFKEVNSASPTQGVYEIHVHNDWLNPAAGKRNLMVFLGGATNMAQVPIEFAIVDYNPLDGVRMGLTALPNAAADAAGGLAISDAGGLDLDAKLANTNEVTSARMAALTDWIDGGRLDLLLDAVKAKTDNLPTDPADASDVASSFSTVNSTLSTIAGYIDTEIATLVSELAKVPKSDSTVSWNATALADINAQCDTAIADGGLATAAKLLKYVQLILRKDSAIATDNATEVTAINADGGSGAGAFANTTDALEAVRDRGDAAWITATGFSTLDAAGVRTAVGLATANLDTQLATIAGYIDSEVASILAAVDTEIASLVEAVITNAAGVDIAADIIALKVVADAIKVASDQLVFTKTNELDVNIQSINGVTITGNGQSGTEFGI